MDKPAFASAVTDSNTFDPIVVNRPPLSARPTLKVVEFNAHGGRHLNGIIDCLRRPPLKGADAILLCEAGWRHRLSMGYEFAAEVAAALGMSFAFKPQFAVPRPEGPPESFLGNAILSSRPLSDVYSVPLTHKIRARSIRRLIGTAAGLVARAVFNGKPLTFGVAHLNSRGSPTGRELQMREFLARFPSDGPAIIGGDFNTTTVDLHNRDAIMSAIRQFVAEPRRLWAPERWEPLFDRLAEAGFKVDGSNASGRQTFTLSGILPPPIRLKLDWIALRGFHPVPGSASVRVARQGLFGPRLSDHDFVVCDVKL
jgi:endonuclease/exonuclease/phosphatase family metal-dependent hydrolase